jgi:hypothetical protein
MPRKRLAERRNMNTLIKNIYENGVEALLRKIRDPFTKRAAKNRCRRCKTYNFNKMYWSCLECEFCCHLINHYLHENDGEGVIVGKIDKEISNVFARHFKKQIHDARKDSKLPSENYITRGAPVRECAVMKEVRE